ncbi:hypothetical protein OIO90_005257 [Microbotryomycetes sp. JL221]|nr:hypothetical protein OIO90_005257 [Microbotryomycetes sp. JL221]
MASRPTVYANIVQQRKPPDKVQKTIPLVTGRRNAFHVVAPASLSITDTRTAFAESFPDLKDSLFLSEHGHRVLHLSESATAETVASLLTDGFAVGDCKVSLTPIHHSTEPLKILEGTISNCMASASALDAIKAMLSDFGIVLRLVAGRCTKSGMLDGNVHFAIDNSNQDKVPPSRLLIAHEGQVQDTSVACRSLRKAVPAPTNPQAGSQPPPPPSTSASPQPLTDRNTVLLRGTKRQRRTQPGVESPLSFNFGPDVGDSSVGFRESIRAAEAAAASARRGTTEQNEAENPTEPPLGESGAAAPVSQARGNQSSPKTTNTSKAGVAQKVSQGGPPSPRKQRVPAAPKLVPLTASASGGNNDEMNQDA